MKDDIDRELIKMISRDVDNEKMFEVLMKLVTKRSEKDD